MRNGENNTERELHFARMLDAPVKLVWEVWTNPEHIKRWWGPDGFTNTIHKMDIKPDGEWSLIMHGPDGSDYEIQSVFREIVKHKKIVYEQLTHFKYIATIEFEGRKDKTLITWTMLFESKEKLIEAAKTYGVIDGFKQNAEKLVNYLLQFN
jgi:uncharacterized protein YndB with AHSA1/START domain